jgi:general secretion pathway protein H
MSNGNRHPEDSASGFSLLEMLVVIAIMTLVLSTAGYALTAKREVSLDQLAQSLVAELRLTRSDAILAGKEVVLFVDVEQRRYWADKRNTTQLPASVVLKLTVADQEQGRGLGGIRFFPNGQSTGGEIVLERNASRVAVRTEWLTGRAHVVAQE